MLQLFGTPSLVGLDISSTSVKLIELSKQNGRYRVESYAVEPVATGAVVEKSISDPETVGTAIQQAVRRSRTTAKHAAVAVAGSAVITKIITLPATLNDDDMASQIELEADHYIPYPLEEVNLDFEVMGPSEHDSETVDVLLSASRRENVDTRVAAVELGGLTARVVDVEAYAAESAVALMAQHMKNLSTDQTIAVFDIGATMTRLTVLDHLKIVYTREQGEEIPFLEASSSGAVTVSFKKAVLSLRVKPQITPDNHIIMDITVHKDSRGALVLLAGSQVPAIDTKQVSTQVLVDNGETIVLGGVYEQTTSNTSQRVPFLGDLPYIGFLFKQEIKLNNKNELLIFVTPKILEENLGLQ